MPRRTTCGVYLSWVFTKTIIGPPVPVVPPDPLAALEPPAPPPPPPDPPPKPPPCRLKPPNRPRPVEELLDAPCATRCRNAAVSPPGPPCPPNRRRAVSPCVVDDAVPCARRAARPALAAAMTLRIESAGTPSTGATVDASRVFRTASLGIA